MWLVLRLLSVCSGGCLVVGGLVLVGVLVCWLVGCLVGGWLFVW